MSGGQRTALSDESARRLVLADFAAVPEVVAFSYADGPSGIRGAVNATAFPTTIALAASGDSELAAEFGRAVAHELFAAGHNVLLGPGVDIARDPHAGRLGESLGEDPLLAGELAGHILRAVHGEGALTVLKHYVGNNVERLRTGTGPFHRRSDAVDVRIPEGALHEVYLAPFRRAVRHGALGLMGSYNRLGGDYVCHQRDLLAIPRERWGFDGFIVPDFLFAVRNARAALGAELDLPGLEGSAGRTEAMLDEVGIEHVRRMAMRIASAADTVGLRPATGELDPSGLGTPEALHLAERILIAGSVLLRNDGALLPLPGGTRVALIGPDPRGFMSVGGSGSVTLVRERVPDLVSELEGAGFAVARVAGTAGDAPLPALTVDRTVAGIHARLVDDESGQSLDVALDTAAVDMAALPDGFGAGAWSAEVALSIPVTTDGPQRLSLEFGGDAELLLDGEPVAAGSREASPMMHGPHYPIHAIVERSAGDVLEILVRYRSGAGLVIDEFGLSPHVSLGHAAVASEHAAAAEAAAAADVAIVLVGRVSGEAMDVDGLRLPADQEALIAAVTAANPRTLVVTASANPVVMPWRESVAAILHVWQPGERLAPALAAMLSGAAEPGGRLPITVPADEFALPFDPPADAAALSYAEGSAVGYRGYEERGITPAYAFGHGLGYAHIATDVLDLGTSGARVRLTCGDDRGGKAVVQLYGQVEGSAYSVLCGWSVAHLAAGETREIVVPVDVAALARWDSETQQLIVPEGDAVLSVGLARDHLLESRAVPLDRIVVDG